MAYTPTPIGVGRGQAQVLQLKPSSKYVDTAGNAQRKADANQAKAQQDGLNKLLDVDFDYGWVEQDNQIQAEIDNYRNKIIGWNKEGGDMNDPDFQRVAKAEQDRIKLLARKSDDDKAVYTEVLSEIEKDNRYDKNLARQNLNKTIYEYDEQGNGIGAKEIWDINREDSFNTLKDPSGYNMTKVYNKMTDDMPSKIDNVIRQWNLDGAEGSITNQTRTDFKGKAFKVVNGKAVLDIYSEDEERKAMARALALEDPFFKNYYDKQIEEGATDDEAFKEYGAYLGTGIGKIKTVKTKNTPLGTKVKDDKPAELDGGSATLLNNIEKNPDGTSTQTESIAYKSFTIPGTTDEKPFLTSPRWYKNMQTGEMIKSPAGDMKFEPGKVIIVPWTTKREFPASGADQYGEDDKFGKKDFSMESVGGIRYAKQEDLIRQQITDKDAGTKKMVTGFLQLNKDTKIPVQIPYEGVAADLEARTGFTLKNRELSSLSKPEVIDVVKLNLPEGKFKPKEITDLVDMVIENKLTEEELKALIESM